MKHLEDKQLCPHCLKPLHQRPYLMSRKATENVISWTAVAWVVAWTLLLLVIANA